MFKKLIFIFLLFSFVIVAGAQVYAPYSNFKFETKYINPPQDTIYVFYSPDDSSIDQYGVLKAKDSLNTLSSFDWRKFNTVTHVFESFLIETDVLESTLTNLEYGGYQVKVTNADGLEQYYSSWIFIDTFNIKRIKVENTCQYLNLEAVTIPSIYDPYVYFDISVNTPYEILIENDNAAMQDVQWESLEEVFIQNDQYLNTRIQNPPPLIDSKYAIYIKDIFGKEARDTSSVITGKASYALFSLELLNADEVFENTEEPYGEAPLEVKFINESGNATGFEWIGYNDDDAVLLGKPDTLWYSTETDPDNFTYTSGRFDVKLKTINDYGCIDSISFSEEYLTEIIVDSSKIDEASIPNVFTPNGDEVNDIWIFSKLRNEDSSGLLPFTERSVVSMERILVKIYNRWGIKVYEYDGIISEWQGWNGGINGSDTIGEEGIYIYVIKAWGYDEKVFDDKLYTGTLNLFK